MGGIFLSCMKRSGCFPALRGAQASLQKLHVYLTSREEVHTAKTKGKVTSKIPLERQLEQESSPSLLCRSLPPRRVLTMKRGQLPLRKHCVSQTEYIRPPPARHAGMSHSEHWFKVLA